MGGVDPPPPYPEENARDPRTAEPRGALPRLPPPQGPFGVGEFRPEDSKRRGPHESAAGPRSPHDFFVQASIFSLCQFVLSSPAEQCEYKRAFQIHLIPIFDGSPRMFRRCKRQSMHGIIIHTLDHLDLPPSICSTWGRTQKATCFSSIFCSLECETLICITIIMWFW